MQNVDLKSRNEANLPFKQEIVESFNEEYPESTFNSGVKMFELIALISIFILSTTAFILIVFFITNSQNINLRNLNKWNLAQARRMSLSLFILSEITFLIGLTNNRFTASYFNIVYTANHLQQTIEKLTVANNDLLGSNDIPSIMGMDSELDKYNFYNICTSFEPAEDVSDSYACSGLIKNYNYVSTLALTILKDPKSISFSIDSEWFHIHQIINKCIRARQVRSSEILRGMLINSINSYKNIIIITSIGVFIYIFIFCLIFYLAQLMNKYFEGALLLLRRLSPMSVVLNGPLFLYLIQKDINKSKNYSNVFSYVIQGSQDYIICLKKMKQLK
jgi:hypothetical protein